MKPVNKFGTVFSEIGGDRQELYQDVRGLSDLSDQDNRAKVPLAVERIEVKDKT